MPCLILNLPPHLESTGPARIMNPEYFRARSSLMMVSYKIVSDSIFAPHLESDGPARIMNCTRLICFLNMFAPHLETSGPAQILIREFYPEYFCILHLMLNLTAPLAS